MQQAKAQYLGTLADHPAAGGRPAPGAERAEHLAGPAPGPVARDGRGQGSDPAGRAGRHRRHAGRSAAPPPGRPGGGNAAGGAVRADRRERGGPLSVDLAAGLAGPVGHVAQRVAAGAELGARAQPGLERVRPWPADQRRAGAGRALPAALRAVPGRGAARGARGRRRRGRLCQDRRADRAARGSR